MFASLYFDLPDEVDLSLAAATVFRVLGITDFEERESSNYVDDQYFAAQSGEVRYEISLSDDENAGDLRFWLTLETEESDENAEVRVLEDSVVERLGQAGARVARVHDFGKKTEHVVICDSAVESTQRPWHSDETAEYPTLSSADLPETIERALDDIQFSRLAILPPYSYNDDEDWRDPRAYLDFYRSVGQESIAASENYLTELRLLKESGEINNNDMKSLFASRRRFLRSFPFCYDELENLPEEQFELAHRDMCKVYKKEISGTFLLTHLDRYIENVRLVSTHAISS